MNHVRSKGRGVQGRWWLQGVGVKAGVQGGVNLVVVSVVIYALLSGSKKHTTKYNNLSKHMQYGIESN